MFDDKCPEALSFLGGSMQDSPPLQANNQKDLAISRKNPENVSSPKKSLLVM